MASRSLGVLTLDLIMKLGGFKQGADQAQKQFDQMTKGIKKSASDLKSSLAGIGGSILGGLSILAVIDATAEAERALAKLDAAVKSNGGAAGRTTKELEQMSSELQNISIFGDDAIQTAQSLLLRFNSISGDNFDRATKSVLDLSSALDKDLSTVAVQLGRALEDPERGLTRLARTGVVFSAAQEAIVKGFLETGEKAKAQAFILDELESKFGGAAEAARNNFGGAITGLRNAFGDLLEGKNGLPEATARLEEFTELLASDEAAQSADVFKTAIINAFGAIASVAASAFGLIAKAINAAADLGARLDKAIFNRKFDDETEKRLFGIAGQLDRLRQQRDQLLSAPRGSFMGGTSQELIQIENQIAELEAARSKGPTSRGGRRGSATADGITVLTDDDAEDAAKLFDETRTAAEKYADEIKRLDELLAKKAISQETYNRAVAKADESLNKARSAGGSAKSTASEFETAKTRIEDAIRSLEQQISVFGKGEQAALQYSVTQGELAKSLEKVGAQAGPLREKLLALADQSATQQATDAIEKQIQALYEQTATMGLSEEQVFQYSLAQGELSKQLAATGQASDELKARLDAANAGLAEARRQLEQEAEAKNIFEATRTDAEKYAQTLKDLGELAKDEAINQETYGRAIADSVVEYVNADSAAEAYRLRIEELNRLLSEGTIAQEGYNEAVVGVDAAYEKAAREASEAFRDEAKRNVQGIVADFLNEPFERGIDGLIQDFDAMFRQIAAQAIAAKIADKLFAGFDDWLDKVIKGIGSISSGSGGGLGGILGSIGSAVSGFFGGGGGGLEDIIITTKKIPGYDDGGFTGFGGKFDAAGIVHANEFVVRSEAALQPGAMSFLESFNQRGMSALRGYATGGRVGGVASKVLSSSAMLAASGGDSIDNSSVMSVTQNFNVTAPGGTISRSAEQQIMAAAARGLASANRRNN